MSSDIEDESAPVQATAPSRVEHGANRAASTQRGYDNAKRYINMYLNEKQFPEFDNLTETDVEGDHLVNFMENIYLWLAVTQIKTQHGLPMVTSGKQIFYVLIFYCTQAIHFN